MLLKLKKYLKDKLAIFMIANDDYVKLGMNSGKLLEVSIDDVIINNDGLITITAKVLAKVGRKTVDGYFNGIQSITYKLDCINSKYKVKKLFFKKHYFKSKKLGTGRIVIKLAYGEKAMNIQCSDVYVTTMD